MNLTDEDVDEILRLLEKSPYTELKLTTDRFTLELKQQSASVRPLQPEDAADDTGGFAEVGQIPPVTTAAVSGETVDIHAPLPGTFYRAPSPGAPPFAEVGQPVEPDSIVGLVETMKMMNSIVAGCRGEVIEICIENGTLVEKEDVLMRLRVAENG